MNSNPFLINVELLDITGKGHIYNKFNYETEKTLYEQTNEDGIPIIYNFMYKYIKQLSLKQPIITFSPDKAISGSSIAGLGEKYMFRESIENNIIFKSKLKIIYLTPRSHLNANLEPINIETCTNSIISNLMFNVKATYTNHHLVFSPEQFIMIGINENLLEDIEMENLVNSDIMFFTLNRIEKIGLPNIIKAIKDICDDLPVHIVFDMSVMDIKYAPCVTRNIKEKDENKFIGLTLTHLDTLLTEFSKLNIVGLDITGYDIRPNNLDSNDIAHRITCETARLPLIKLFKFKEKSINIFNEHTKFLIWRPCHQVSEEDIGWFILRGVSLSQREKLLAHIKDDTIIIENIDDEYVYISSTTMQEQEMKNYACAIMINDCTLFYEEKVHMMFELLNTNENSLLL